MGPTVMTMITPTIEATSIMIMTMMMIVIMIMVIMIKITGRLNPTAFRPICCEAS